MSVEIRELTTGEILDLYDKKLPEGSQFQYELLIMTAMSVETGLPMFKTFEDIRALPGRMLPGLIDAVRVSTELNALTTTEEGDRPTSRPEENISSN